jgi:hypothetical protein
VKKRAIERLKTTKMKFVRLTVGPWKIFSTNLKVDQVENKLAHYKIKVVKDDGRY